MAQMIFVNLPVKDLETTKGFFEKLGYGFNPAFSDDKTACLVISDTIFAMLMTEPRFKDFTKKDVTDASKSTEVILALSCDSREEVDRLADAAPGQRLPGRRDAGPGLHVRPLVPGPRPPQLGGHLDGPGRRRGRPGLSTGAC